MVQLYPALPRCLSRHLRIDWCLCDWCSVRRPRWWRLRKRCSICHGLLLRVRSSLGHRGSICHGLLLRVRSSLGHRGSICHGLLLRVRGSLGHRGSICHRCLHALHGRHGRRGRIGGRHHAHHGWHASHGPHGGGCIGCTRCHCCTRWHGDGFHHEIGSRHCCGCAGKGCASWQGAWDPCRHEPLEAGYWNHGKPMTGGENCGLWMAFTGKATEICKC